mgnify:CR=1 FL=1
MRVKKREGDGESVKSGRVMRNVMGLNGAAMKIKLILWIYIML